MELPEDAVLLRIFLGESDRFGKKPLYEAIVLKARELHMAGATVLRGPMGFGKSSRLHTAKLERLSEDLPFVLTSVLDRPCGGGAGHKRNARRSGGQFTRRLRGR